MIPSVPIPALPTWFAASAFHNPRRPSHRKRRPTVLTLRLFTPVSKKPHFPNVGLPKSTHSRSRAFQQVRAHPKYIKAW